MGVFWWQSEKYERPIQTLLRECEEELGVLPDINKVFPLNQFISPDKKFEYNTFVIAVFEEFIPMLNNESEGYAWVKIGNYKTFTPGVKAQLYNRRLIEEIGPSRYLH